MSVRIMARVWEKSEAKGSARLVLLALADTASDAGEIAAYPRSQSHLARKCQLTIRGVQKALVVLVEMGELTVIAKGDGRASTDYRITLRDEQSSPLDVTDADDEGRTEFTPATNTVPPRDEQDSPQGRTEFTPIIPSSSVHTRPSSVKKTAAEPDAALLRAVPNPPSRLIENPGQLADALADLIESDGRDRPKVTNADRLAADRLARRVERGTQSPLERIRDVVRWAVLESDFWPSNIVKFRDVEKHWDRMLAQWNARDRKTARRHDPVAAQFDTIRAARQRKAAP